MLCDLSRALALLEDQIQRGCGETGEQPRFDRERLSRAVDACISGGNEVTEVDEEVAEELIVIILEVFQNDTDTIQRVLDTLPPEFLHTFSQKLESHLITQPQMDNTGENERDTPSTGKRPQWSILMLAFSLIRSLLRLRGPLLLCICVVILPALLIIVAKDVHLPRIHLVERLRTVSDEGGTPSVFFAYGFLVALLVSRYLPFLWDVLKGILVGHATGPSPHRVHDVLSVHPTKETGVEPVDRRMQKRGEGRVMGSGYEYGLDHVLLNLRCDSLWLNMGYWKGTRDFREATTALARKVADAARIDSMSNVIDFGYGCGDQLLFFAKNYPISRLVGVTLEPAQGKLAFERLSSLSRPSAIEDPASARMSSLRECDYKLRRRVGFRLYVGDAVDLETWMPVGNEMKKKKTKKKNGQRFLRKTADSTPWVPYVIVSSSGTTTAADEPVVHQIENDGHVPKFGEYDVAISLDSCYHYRDRRRFLEMVWAALKPGGRVALSDLIVSEGFEDHYERLFGDPVSTSTSLDGGEMRQRKRGMQKGELPDDGDDDDGGLSTRSGKIDLKLSVICTATGIPRENMVPLNEYVRICRSIGFEDIEIEDITEDVFGGLAKFVQQQDERMKHWWGGGGAGAPRGWRQYKYGVKALMGWLDRRRILRFVIVSMRKGKGKRDG